MKATGGTSLNIKIIQSVFFLLVDSPASEFYVLTFSEHSVSSIFIGGVSRKKNWDKLFPVMLSVYATMKMELTERFETKAHKIQTLRNHPKQSIQQSEHRKSWKKRTHNLSHTVNLAERTQNYSSTTDNTLLDNSRNYFSSIQGVPGGMCQTSGGCSLC